MVSGDCNNERAFGAFLPADLVECDGGFGGICPCFCNFYIFAKVFDFADIFELQSEGLEGFNRVDLGFGARRKKLSFVGIFVRDIDGFIVAFFGMFEDIDDTVDGP